MVGIGGVQAMVIPSVVRNDAAAGFTRESKVIHIGDFLIGSPGFPSRQNVVPQQSQFANNRHGDVFIGE
jgi:hypothetical protein